MKKLLSLILLAAMAVGVLAGCAGRAGGESSSGGNELVGTWVCDYGMSNGTSETMTVGSDGRLTISFFGGGETVNVEGTYTVSGDVITVSFSTGRTAEYAYTLDGDTLTLWVETENGKEKYRTYAAVVDGGANPLFGEWVCDFGDEIDTDEKYGETITFDAGGKATVSYYELYGTDDAVFNYTVSGDKLTLSGVGSNKEYSYAIEGNALTLWAEGANGKEPYRTYLRWGSAEKGSGLDDAAQLAGKWYGEYGSTLVLNADGTGESYGEYDGEEYHNTFTYTIIGGRYKESIGGETVEDLSYRLEKDDVIYFCIEASEWGEYYVRADGTESSDNELAGNWVCTHDNADTEAHFLFTSSGTGAATLYGPLTYEPDGDGYKVTYDSYNGSGDLMTGSLTVKIDGDMLCVFSSDEGTCELYYRAGTAAPDLSPKKLVGSWKSSNGYRITIDEDSLIDNGKNFISRGMDYEGWFEDDDGYLCGVQVWSDIINLLVDTGSLFKSYRYKLDGNKLTLYNFDGSLAGKFTKA